MSHTLHPLEIHEVINETPDTMSLVFHVPDELKDTFAYQAGQYLTLAVEINGHEERRAYSISSAPFEGLLKVSVKKVADGTVSRFICEHVKQGDTIKVMPPEGRFTFSFDADQRRAFYFIAAGSGITPIISLIKDGLEKEPMRRISFLATKLLR